jgi:hypothetical protein
MHLVGRTQRISPRFFSPAYLFLFAISASPRYNLDLCSRLSVSLQSAILNFITANPIRFEILYKYYFTGITNTLFPQESIYFKMKGFA